MPEVMMPSIKLSARPKDPTWRMVDGADVGFCVGRTLDVGLTGFDVGLTGFDVGLWSFGVESRAWATGADARCRPRDESIWILLSSVSCLKSQAPFIVVIDDELFSKMILMQLLILFKVRV